MRLSIFTTDGGEVNVDNFDPGSALDLREMLESDDPPRFITLDLGQPDATSLVAVAHIARVDFDQ